MNSHRIILYIFGVLFICYSQSAHAQIFSTSNGKIHFTSDAPLELIEAESQSLRGLIDAQKLTFVFSVRMSSFQGFNSPLQQEHFNEKFLESAKFPNATFNGKIIEKVDFSQSGTYSVRAKGILTIHGIEQERIIRGNLVVGLDHVSIQAEFKVPLSDHNIDIPSIVFQKIAEEIEVTMEAELKQK